MEILKFLETNGGWIVEILGLLSALLSKFATKKKNWDKVKSAIEEYVKEAEILNTDGAVKKKIVMSKARTLCSILHIRFDDKKISSIIEGLITLTKSVNAREKDKKQCDRNATYLSQKRLKIKEENSQNHVEELYVQECRLFLDCK